ncbi:uracil nucleotide/cysteinyl leukotriene receptor-like [Danio aesculapii]|uniref:uracil nucleotide/cysteinyl leukotriene receptor-like n=1 Tax=Danio aesculapii TaxID=1142201 RepID=UPI0024BFF632|nr:uracil nucleotide/cysteinyl leukotriene receptor-like [Danio aesculapii]
MNNSTINFTSEASTNSLYILFLSTLDLSIYYINFLFGFPTHSYVLWLIVTGSSEVSSEFFNLNLCVCELGICLHSLLSVILYCFKLPYDIPLFLLGLIITGRPLFQCVICVERYLAVVHPVTFLKYKPLRYRVICCAVAWIIILISCVFCMLTSLQIKINVYFSLSQYVLFLSVQLFCLVAVLRALKQSGPGERKREKEENQMKRRAFFIILIATVTMSVSYIPYIISGFLYCFTQNYIGIIFSLGFLCFILGGFVEPVLYLHRSGKMHWLCSI